MKNHPTREFYAQDTVVVAKKLLGMHLVRKLDDGTTLSGIITETEAYKHQNDPASHAFSGITNRNQVMFGEVGMAYVYFTYGMHYCMNVVAHSKNAKAGAVLIRAITPQKGIKQMLKNRKNPEIKNLANGPAKVAQALQITKEQYGVDITKRGAELCIVAANNNSTANTKKLNGIYNKKRIMASTRIGITKAIDKKWNFKMV